MLMTLRWMTTMKLNSLEAKFFDVIVGSELDVPVHATLECQGSSLEMIVVPTIGPEGYLRFEYYNATAYQPEPTTAPDGSQYHRFSMHEAGGRHPMLVEAWDNRSALQLDMKPSRPPLRPKSNTKLDVRVLYADHRNRGALVWSGGPVAAPSPWLRRAEFSISGFADFKTSRKAMVFDRRHRKGP